MDLQLSEGGTDSAAFCEKTSAMTLALFGTVGESSMRRICRYAQICVLARNSASRGRERARKWHFGWFWGFGSVLRENFSDKPMVVWCFLKEHDESFRMVCSLAPFGAKRRCTKARSGADSQF